MNINVDYLAAKYNGEIGMGYVDCSADGRSLRTNECAHRSLDQVRRCQWNPRLLRKAVASQSRRHVRCAERFLFLLSFTLVESITYFDSKEGYDQLVHSSDVVFICAYVILL